MMPPVNRTISSTPCLRYLTMRRACVGRLVAQCGQQNLQGDLLADKFRHVIEDDGTVVLFPKKVEQAHRRQVAAVVVIRLAELSKCCPDGVGLARPRPPKEVEAVGMVVGDGQDPGTDDGEAASKFGKRIGAWSDHERSPALWTRFGADWHRKSHQAPQEIAAQGLYQRIRGVYRDATHRTMRRRTKTPKPPPSSYLGGITTFQGGSFFGM